MQSSGQSDLLYRLALACLIAAPLTTSGCAAFRPKGPVDPDESRCRQFSCQGVTALEQGNCQQAEQYLRQAVKAAPSDPDAHRHLAEALWASGDRNQSIQHLREAARLEPTHAATACRLGQIEAATGQWQLAMSRAEVALKHDPKLADAWALRARAFQESGDLDRAAADMFRALQYSPSNREALRDLAGIYRQQGKHQRRLATIHRLKETFPPSEAPDETIVLEADAYIALERTQEAAEQLRLAAGRTAPSAGLLHRLAEAEATLGHRPQAIAAAQRALAVDQAHLPSQQLLAKLSAPANPLY